MKITLSNLQKERALLVDKLDEINKQIAALDVLIESRGGSAVSSPKKAAKTVEKRPDYGALVDDFLKQVQGTFTKKNVCDYWESKGVENVSGQSIANHLIKLTADGGPLVKKVEGVGRKATVYALRNAE